VPLERERHGFALDVGHDGKVAVFEALFGRV
jgi:hypothetical protein